MDASPVEIRVYDKALAFQAVVGDLESYSFTPRLNAQGTGELVMPWDSHLNDLLRTPGTRVSCRYRDGHLMSGPIRTRQGAFITRNTDATATFEIQDDWRVLVNSVARVNPAGHVQATTLDDPAQAWQTAPGVSGTVTGRYGYYLWPASIRTAEAAIKHLVSINLVRRLRRPITVLPDGGRGGDARIAGMLPEVRNQTVAEAIEKLLTWSGLVMDVWQDFDTATIFVDVHESDEWSQTITPESGIITDGDWSQKPADATRVLIQGPGEDAARAFAEIVDADLEAEYGDIIEVTRDATGGTLTWPDGLEDDVKVAVNYLIRPDVAATDKAAFVSYLAEAGNDALDDGAPTASLAMELTETDSFRYGETIFLGDSITAESNGIRASARIEECDITLTAADGDKCVPVLGKRSDDPNRDLWDAIAGVDKALRNTIRKR